MIELLVSVPAILLFITLAALTFRLYVTRPGLEGTPPGPMGLPFVGYMPFLGKYPWIGLDRLRDKYPSLIALYMGKDYTIILQDYEAVKAAMIDQDENFIGRPEEFLTRYMSSGKDGQVHGILFAEGPKWQATHNFCKETFRRLGVDTPRFDKVILNETLRLINVWRGQAGGFNPAVYIFPATVNAVSGLLFSRPLEYMGEEFHRLTKREEEGFAVVIGGLVQEYPLLRFIPGPLKNGWDAVRYTTEQEWNLFEKELVRHEETYSEDQVRDLFDAYIRHVRGNDDFDPQAMQSRCTDGPTATNVALLWALLFLCLHPDVQEKVHEEIDRVVGKDRPITSADRNNLPFTMGTIWEALRLGGNAPLGNPRSNPKETRLLGYSIPKRTRVMPNIWSIHRNPQYWNDPLSFKPQRFVGADGKLHVPPQMLAFSTGSRSCPGVEVAISIMFIIFANIMQQLEVRTAKRTSLPSTTEYQFGISLKPLNYHIEVTSRV